jgi:hypothetical protein
MVRVLRNLRINEVSTVDRGAGDACRIVLWKRDDTVAPDNDGNDDDDEAYAAALHYLMHTAQGAGVVRRFFPHGASGTAEIEHLARLVAHVVRARDNGDAAESDPYQSWADTIGNDDETEDDDAESADTIGDAATEKKVFHMSDRNEVLKAAVRRDGGVVPLCKRICAHGAGDITEAELTGMLTEHAQQLYPDMSPEGAFTKIYTSPGGEPLRRAVQIAKGLMDIEPVAVGVGDSDTDDAAKAYQQLARLAEVQKRRSPSLSAAQAFERATRDRPDLLARAVPRR